MEQILVSVVVISYNSSRFVVETLNSIKNQTYKNIELVITDDCSQDNTIEICEAWINENRDRFAQTKIVTTSKNTGIPGNCNRGVKNSHGRWIKMIAADDSLLETCIEDNMAFIKDNPGANFIVSDLLEMNDNSELIEKQQDDKGLKLYFSEETAADQLRAYARWPEFLNSPSFFINRKLLQLIDYFDESYRIYDDMTLIYRVNLMNEKIYYLNKPTVIYRIHDQSISRGNVINDIRSREIKSIFKKYRKMNLNKKNLIDLSVYYEHWLNHYWKGIGGYKGHRILFKFSLFYWYVRYKLFVIDKIKPKSQ